MTIPIPRTNPYLICENLRNLRMKMIRRLRRFSQILYRWFTVCSETPASHENVAEGHVIAVVVGIVMLATKSF